MKVEIKETNYCEYNSSHYVIVNVSNGNHTVTLTEWLNIDEDGDKFAETKDSYIATNQLSLFASLFDLSEKPTLMPVLDFLGDKLDDLYNEINIKLNLLKEEEKVLKKFNR